MPPSHGYVEEIQKDFVQPSSVRRANPAPPIHFLHKDPDYDRQGRNHFQRFAQRVGTEVPSSDAMRDYHRNFVNILIDDAKRDSPGTARMFKVYLHYHGWIIYHELCKKNSNIRLERLPR